MKIGTVFDYDPATNTWLTISDTNNAWLTALIHTLRSEPSQHPFYAQHGVATLDALQSDLSPMSHMLRTQQQFSKYFKVLILTQKDSLKPEYTISYQFFDSAKPSAMIINLEKYK
jgi:hypothetical protein